MRKYNSYICSCDNYCQYSNISDVLLRFHQFCLVTGNANFRMAQTTFTLVGFTQPQTALPIIQDAQNHAKGFTSRLLWFFPKPVFCKISETMLSEDEADELHTFKRQLGE